MAEDDIIEIRDHKIKVKKIKRRIRENIARRKAAEGAKEVEFPTFEPSSTTYHPEEADLHSSLQQAKATHANLYVGLYLTKRGPRLLGQPWALLRRKFHELALFYVNILAGKQTLFNTHVVHTLERIVKALEDRGSQEELENQGREIERLRRRVERLERALTGEKPGSSR